jgi:alpha-L-arabinofuranosidase
MTELDVYSSDEHYYMNPQWFISNQDRFDDFDRDKPKIFVGEYASHSANNSLFDAVAEAAFLTGVERNGDIVDMACYAPLFAHYDHTQWGAANLIWFDKRNVVKTPNYYVQQMFSVNAGDVYVKNTVTAEKSDEPLPTIAGGVGIATWDTAIEIENPTVNGRQLDPADWNARAGQFSMQNGRYVQTDTSQQPAISFSEQKFDGDTVTYTVRAHKTDGAEGFMLVFGAEDEDSYYWFNVGGWGNEQHGIERTDNGSKSILAQRRGSVRTDTWYTAKVELSSGRIRCWLNDEQVIDYEMNTPDVAVSSTLDKTAEELIVKLVNPSDEPVNATIAIDGADVDSDTAAAMVIAGAAGARNSIQNPNNVRTQTKQLSVDEEFDVTLPAASVQFIRIKVDN